MRRLLLKSFQSPGDILMLTAAVRDLHQAHPHQFQTDVRTSADALWQNSPYVTPLQEGRPGVESIDMQYPLVHQSNQRPYHFLHGYVQFLEKHLKVDIPVTRFHGDIHLSENEKKLPPPGHEVGVGEHFWIVMAGGKNDFTAKWWNPDSYQKVVDHFQGRIQFVQCGEQSHWHPRLRGVIDLVGKTPLREFVRLMYHADGVLCPVTFAMHLAAAVETRPGRPRRRACVVVAGGREPPHWEAYPQHQFLSTVGALQCCMEGGCWRSRCQLIGDGDDKDRRNVCEMPVQISPELRIPKCMHMITPEDVIRRIELYYQGGALSYLSPTSPAQPNHPEANGMLTSVRPAPPVRSAARNILIEFRHGLGDAVQLTIVLRHLRHYHPDWHIDLNTLIGKHSLFNNLCRNIGVLDRNPIPQSGYEQVYSLDWHECRSLNAACPSTKASRCLVEQFHLQPTEELCKYTIHVSERAKEAARSYLESVCKGSRGKDGRYSAVLIHYQGNTSADRKDLPHDVIRDVCALVEQLGFTPVILDWDRRSPLPNGSTIHNPNADNSLWGGSGTGDGEIMAALIESASLMIGVDSGPLHVAGATSTPTIGVWTHHHPIHFFDLAENVIHLVPGDHEKFAAGRECLNYFYSHYRYRVYKQLSVDLLAQVESLLTGKDVEQLAMKQFLGRLSSRSYGQRYYHEHRDAGCDYSVFGEWQQKYGRWFVESLDLKGKRVLDVGCACGAIVQGLGQAEAVAQGVDLSEYMVQLGRQQWPDMANLIFVCDAVNLHLYENESWDVIHSNQVAEHWKPELVPFILAEFKRVVRPGGLLFCALDTQELFARQNRKVETEDPTHVCIRPMSWWHKQLIAAGWEVCGEDFDKRLRDHPDSFLRRYDWDWFLARSCRRET